MSNIKMFLQKWPSIYRAIQKGYYILRKFVETYLLGTRLQEWIWKRQRIYTADDNATGYLGMVKHPHRQLLQEKISSYTPIGSILEIGCNAGFNLFLLSQCFPEAKIFGVDINKKAIREGREIFKKYSIHNVTLTAGKADCLRNFMDKSVDVVLTDSVLMYVAPDKIRSILNEIFRIVKKVAVFSEWDAKINDEKAPQKSMFHNGHWIHNFDLLLQNFVPGGQVRKTKITQQIWNDNMWSTFGCIIEAPL